MCIRCAFNFGILGSDPRLSLLVYRDEVGGVVDCFR